MNDAACFLFDFDGVIIDSTELIHQCFSTVFAMHNSTVPDDVVRKVAGMPLNACFSVLGFREPDVDAAVKAYRDFQEQNVLRLVKVFPEVAETVSFLKQKGFKTGIVTGRARASTEMILNNFSISQYFDCIVASGDVINHKPHPEPVLKALKILEGSAEKSFFVGDAEVDLLAGKAAGVKTIAATYTAGSSLNHLGPDFLIDSFGELKLLVEKK